MHVEDWNYINVISTIKNKNINDLYNNEYIGVKKNNKNVNIIKLINDINPYNGISTLLINNKFYKTDEYLDTTNPAIVEKYIKYATYNNPSRYTCLLLSGHNYTWLSKELLKYKDKYMHLISPNKFSLQNCLKNIGGVDILVFNTCCGMAVETLYNIRDCCNILVGNMDYTGWEGVDENVVINYLKNSDANPIELSEVIVNNFSPQLDGEINYAISAYATANATSIRNAVCDLASSLINWLKSDTHKNDVHNNKAMICDIRRSITNPNFKTGIGGNGGIDKLSVDLSKLCMEFITKIPDSDIEDNCKKLLDLLFDDKNSYRRSTDAFEGLCCLSIYFPLNDYSLMKEYKNIPFNKDDCDNSWYDFLAFINL